MAPSFWYAVAAAILYGAHQIFTRFASKHIGDGLGGFVVEASAALSILLYLAFLWLSGRWNQKFSAAGFNYSVLTGVCVGAGTIRFLRALPKRRTAFVGACHSRRRRCHHGDNRDSVFSGASLLATSARSRARDHRIVSPAQVSRSSQTAIHSCHRSCPANIGSESATGSLRTSLKCASKISAALLSVSGYGGGSSSLP
jgi:uncharacterized membrane protein